MHNFMEYYPYTCSGAQHNSHTGSGASTQAMHVNMQHLLISTTIIAPCGQVGSIPAGSVKVCNSTYDQSVRERSGKVSEKPVEPGFIFSNIFSKYQKLS